MLFLLNLFMYSVNYLYHYELMDTYFIICFIIQYYIYFIIQVVPTLVIERSFSLAPMPKKKLYYFFTCGHHKMVKTHIVLVQLTLCNKAVFQGTLVLFLCMLGVFIAT